MDKRLKRKLIVNILIFMGVLVFVSINTRAKKEKIIYANNLNQVAVWVNGEKLTLRDLAFYVAYVEKTTNEKARIYDRNKLKKFWNLHINGIFISVEAKKSVMEMAIHDEIFYQKALEEHKKLSLDEKDIAKGKAIDFWSDLTQEQKESLGIEEKDVIETMEKIALGEKYQQKLAEESTLDLKRYDAFGTEYKKIKERNKVKIYNALWEKVDVGNITIFDGIGEKDETGKK